jgi:U4/U6.U5 tri-snRNP-associated protein 1
MAVSDEDHALAEIPELAEPLVGKGLAVALRVLRSRGLVGKASLYGRYKDTGIDRVERIEKEKAAKSELSAVGKSTTQNNENLTIDLEYRDEKGRELTKKEAYRNLCYNFHNKLPSYKKIEKKIKRDEMQQKLMNKDVSVEGITNKYLKNQQLTKDVSYVVLQGKNNNI